jgi:hypothetical protein
VIVAKPVGGLANQLVIYSAAYKLSLLKVDRVYLDLSHFDGNLKRKFRLEELNFEHNICHPLTILLKFKRFAFSSNKVFRFIGEKLNKNGIYGDNCFKENSLEFDESFLYISGDVYLEGDFISYKYYSDILRDLREKFKPKQLSNSALELIEIVKNKNFASIHYRRGDYMTDAVAKSFHGLLDIEYYKNAITELEKLTPVLTYYVFTDDVEVARQDFNFLSNVEFVGEIDGLTDIDELEIMKNIKNNIIANSGFSRWGALLNYNESPNVIMPRSWFRGYDIATTEIGPDNWVRIDSVFI